MQIRGSPNGARHSPPHLSPPGRDRSERVVVFNWKGWSPSIGTGGRHQSVGPPEGLSLYGAFEVKRFSRHSPVPYFLHSSFFVRLEIPFLRPDPHVSEAGAHRGCQGRPSLCLGRTLCRSRPRLDRPEHGGRLAVVGMTHPRGARCRARGTRAATLYPVGRSDPNHDARMRIGGEAPRRWTHS
jgi:hypothetical protein